MRGGTVQEKVDILDLRHFNSGEMRPLLEAEARIWERQMEWDYLPSIDMILRYIDSKILPGYVAVEDGKPLGYSFFVYEGSKGVIGDLFVAEGDPLRSAVIRNQILTHVIETLQQTPGIQRIEAQLLVHDSGVIAQPFASSGFRVFPRLFMEKPLSAAQSGEISAPPDLVLRNWTEADFQAAAQVITAAYANHIDADINDQYRGVAGSLRFLNNIVRFPGCGIFDPGSSFVLVEKDSRRLVGLLLSSRVRADVAHVTQLCILPQHRGRQLGKLLVMASCRNLAARRFSKLTLTVTEANRHAVEIYLHLGFSVQRVFDAFVWES